MSNMEKLKGRKVLSVAINPDKTTLKFILEAGLYDNPILAYDAVGDCCSSSWFNNITGIANLIGEEVLEVVDKEELPESTGSEDEGEYIQYYGFTLKTNKGFCDIEFRNSSNGYYGGYLEENTAPNDDFKNVTEDL